MKYGIIVAVLIALASSAHATTTSFYGTGSADTIVVGRGYHYDVLSYVACINGAWTWGNAVTGSSDVVNTYGYGGADTITIRSTNATFTCGTETYWFFRMDYSYACAGTIYVSGGDGDDEIFGAQCAERLWGDAGYDILTGAGGDDTLSGGTEGDCLDDTTVASMACGAGYDNYTDDYHWKDCEGWVATCYP